MAAEAGGFRPLAAIWRLLRSCLRNLRQTTGDNATVSGYLHRIVSVVWLVAAMSYSGASGPATAEDVVLRVESEVFVNDDNTPVAESLTLFQDGITWDFLDPPAGAVEGDVILHDPARERVIVLDPERNLKTEIRTIRLERLNVSLATWARQSDDPLMQWAGTADFGDAIITDGDRIELTGPRVKYAVEFTRSASDEAVAAYRRFADTAILLKALMQPGGLPPFPRLAINRHVELAGGIPTAVTLSITPKRALLPGAGDTLRSVHKVHPQLIDGDHSRIDAAGAQLTVAEEVDLEEFVRRRHEARSDQPDS
jgi:hypothetical protein